LAPGVDTSLKEEFYRQTIASAVSLGRRYRFDEAHNRHVARLSLLLFDALKNEHGCGERDRLLLEVAATLHDIGMFIRGLHHEKHGQYIVANTEIFGLKPEEQAIVANVIGCHRGPPPDEKDINYMALQREERTLVLKLSALLRIADALDRTHSQRVKDLSLERDGDTLMIRVNPGENRPAGFDLSTERLSLEEKSSLFADVFGYRVTVI
jgi:exopolyphosphatase/guanosine-5'-triphosphate,3'-diphosphate pyrophosphatase